MQAQDGNNRSVNDLNASSPMQHRSVLVTPKQDTSPSLVSIESFNEVQRGQQQQQRRRYVPPPPEPGDDVDLMLRHEEFPTMLTLATKVKQIQQQIAHMGQANECYRQSPSRQLANSALQLDEVLMIVARIHQQILANPRQNSKVLRGMFPLTDSIMDDAIDTLQNEYNHCERWLKRSKSTTFVLSSAKASKKTPKSNGSKSSNSKRKKKEAIAVKYSKWQTDILMNWMIEHKDQPFPDQEQISYLMAQTGLSQSQVVNWTTNVRKRNRKATCEGGKKPHHFIDFLFLAQDRENRNKPKESKNNETPTPTPAVPRMPHLPPPTGYRYHHQPHTAAFAAPQQPQQQQPHPDVVVSDSNALGDPLPLGQALDDDLMQEFADFWLDEDNALLIDDLVEETPQTLLPCVTVDSTEGEHSHNAKRGRSMSMDLTELEDEDIHSWAAELGLAIEV